jgi:hypothetical protein
MTVHHAIEADIGIEFLRSNHVWAGQFRRSRTKDNNYRMNRPKSISHLEAYGVGKQMRTGLRSDYRTRRKAIIAGTWGNSVGAKWVPCDGAEV